MINSQFVTPIGAGLQRPPASPASLSVSEIATILQQRGLSLVIGETLKGGMVSSVYAATDPSGRKLVVKYTNDATQFDPTELLLSHTSHYVDTKLLEFLGANGSVNVPDVIAAWDEIPITVMNDLRADRYQLVNDILVDRRVPVNAARDIGRDLAMMQKALAAHPEFLTTFSGPQVFYERGLELRLAYPNEQTSYLELEERFTMANQQLIAVDSHPKNMFLDAEGNRAWIDFGFSTWGDRDFALPNCMAHFVIYALAGYTSKRNTAELVRQAVAGYRELLPIDDEAFCGYLATEVLHRWAGKWIADIDTAAKKLQLLEFGLEVFDRNMKTIDQLTSAIEAQNSANRLLPND